MHALTPARHPVISRGYPPLVAVVFALVTTAPVGAHDMWIEPTTFVPAAGKIVGTRLRVGQNMLGDPLPHDATLIKEFIVEDATGRRPVVGRPGADPAGMLRVSAPGLLVIGYYSHPSAVDLTAEKFNTYLSDEGLGSVAAIRSKTGRTGDGVRELFSRCAKSLILSGAPARTQADRVLGFRLELVAEKNPYLLTSGDALTVRLTYEGRPLSDALVVALNASDPSLRVAERSDRNGRVRLQLTRGGMWMIKAVHMIAAAPESHADWESFWASLTFELPRSFGVAPVSSR
jgi:uncharacterized GH25 family protein